MSLVRLTALVLLSLLLALPAHATPDSLTRITQEWKGDLPEILDNRRVIRVLVSYNRTNFFMVNGQMRGLEFDLMEAYEKYLVKTHKNKLLHTVFITVPFDDLIPALLEGRGDIIAAGLTITDTRKKQVAFSAPYRKDINEIIVGSKKAAPIKKLNDLAGKTVHVLAGSSYALHLKELNADLKEKGMKQITIKEANTHLVTEDLLEMADRGIIDYTMADSHIAEIWKTALPKIQLFTEAPVRSGGELGWAVRPSAKGFLKSLNDFAATVRQGTLMGNMVFKRYFVNADWVKNPRAQEDKAKVETMRALFEKYGRKYNIDWLKLVALAYQESRFEIETKSSAGAVGVMQIRPSTALDKNVNVKDYDTLEGNIHAGTKYLRFLMDNYFKDVETESRIDFALAAYNAGPARILGLQKKAKAMGLNPNVWFGNVEWAAYKEIGTETPTYVANVQMYYAAYKSIYEVISERREAQ